MQVLNQIRIHKLGPYAMAERVKTVSVMLIVMAIFICIVAASVCIIDIMYGTLDLVTMPVTVIISVALVCAHHRYVEYYEKRLSYYIGDIVVDCVAYYGVEVVATITDGGAVTVMSIDYDCEE